MLLSSSRTLRSRLEPREKRERASNLAACTSMIETTESGCLSSSAHVLKLGFLECVTGDVAPISFSRNQSFFRSSRYSLTICLRGQSPRTMCRVHRQVAARLQTDHGKSPQRPASL